jgi:hypothetical protein
VGETTTRNGILCELSPPSRRPSGGVLAMFARKFLGQNTLEALKVVAADGIAQGIDRKWRRRNWSD